MSLFSTKKPLLTNENSRGKLYNEYGYIGSLGYCEYFSGKNGSIMKNIQTLKGIRNLDQYRRICAHEHLLLDMTHEAVEPKTKAEKELFYSEVTMEKLGALRRNPYIVRENLILDSTEDAISELTYL